MHTRHNLAATHYTTRQTTSPSRAPLLCPVTPPPRLTVKLRPRSYRPAAPPTYYPPHRACLYPCADRLPRIRHPDRLAAPTAPFDCLAPAACNSSCPELATAAYIRTNDRYRWRSGPPPHTLTSFVFLRPGLTHDRPVRHTHAGHSAHMRAPARGSIRRILPHIHTALAATVFLARARRLGLEIVELPLDTIARRHRRLSIRTCVGTIGPLRAGARDPERANMC